MENDVMNTYPSTAKKAVVRKVFPIAWLILCTALFVQFLRVFISNIIFFNNLTIDNSITGAGWVISIYSLLLTACIVIYASAAGFLIPKIIAAFRSPEPPHTTDRLVVVKRILLIAWAIVFVAALVGLLCFTILALSSYVNVSLPSYIESYETYERLVAEGDSSYINRLESAAAGIELIKSNIIIMSVYVVALIVLYVPFIALFVLKIRAAFLLRKNSENQSL